MDPLITQVENTDVFLDHVLPQASLMEDSPPVVLVRSVLSTPGVHLEYTSVHLIFTCLHIWSTLCHTGRIKVSL